tara:strand:+ start:217 stop:1317 length:1101 start_codon:yes stop_codon:yes gene_type:complete
MTKVRYSYLKQQFSNAEDLWDELKKFVPTGDFTLGKPLYEFEDNFAKMIGVNHAIGVNSGTDAIKIPLKALGIKPGDEIITAANTFVATVGAIREIGAIPVFVDCDDTFCMDTNLIEQKITKKTRALVPVHFTGYMTNMENIMHIANKYNLTVVEDACQSILGEYKGKKAGCWGDAASFSLHPLKNLNVWSDGGIITTNSKDINDKVRLLRNHGLIDRDTVEVMGYNSRLDTLQAVVGNWLLPKTHEIANQRIKNANYLDNGLGKIKQIRIPDRPKDFKIVYHLYIIFAQERDGLLEHCLANGIEAKIHYPKPIYLQNALSDLGYKKGDFPITDKHAKSIISFPCDQHLEIDQLDYIIDTVKNFYK